MNTGNTNSIVPTKEEIAEFSKPKPASFDSSVVETIDEKKILEDATKIFALNENKDEPALRMNASESMTVASSEPEYHTISGGPETVNDIKKKASEIQKEPHLYSAIGMNKETFSRDTQEEVLSLFVIFLKLSIIVDGLLLVVIFGGPILLGYLVEHSYLVITDGRLYNIGTFTVPVDFLQELGKHLPKVIALSLVALTTAFVSDIFSGNTLKFYVRFIIFAVLIGIIVAVEYYLRPLGVDLFSGLYDFVREQLAFLH